MRLAGLIESKWKSRIFTKYLGEWDVEYLASCIEMRDKLHIIWISIHFKPSESFDLGYVIYNQRVTNLLFAIV